MGTYTIKHIHKQDAHYTNLYFIVNNKLLRMEIVSILYADSSVNWEVEEICLSDGDYNPDGDDVELKPLNIPDLEIDEHGLEFLKIATTDGWFEYQDLDNVLENIIHPILSSYRIEFEK